MGDEDKIVHVEYNQKGDRYYTSVVQVVLPADCKSATCHHDERKGKYDSPANDVYHGFDDVVAGGSF